MKELKKLFDNNKEFQRRKLKEDESFFKRLAILQSPKYFWVGCSDSRIPANEIVGLEPGELFVHRNVGSLFPSNDSNCLAALEFAVDTLKVEHVIVCGHYGCGAMQAALEKGKKDAVDIWLQSVRELYTKHKKELDAIEDLEKRANHLAELNVKEQVQNICKTSIAQKAWKRNQKLCVHGWIYDLKTGLLKDLNLCISDPKYIA